MASAASLWTSALILALAFCTFASAQQKAAGQLTRYCSYPPCCNSSGISYTPAERQYCGQDECDDYSGCRWEGQFAFCQFTRQQVIQYNIVSFFSSRESIDRYVGKTLRITQGSKSIDAVVCDTCGDSDCDGCCTRNAQPSGYLLDLESNTYARSGFNDGSVQWTCLNC